MTFVAVILANTLSPQANENGLALRVATGMVQALAATIAGLEPSQLVSSVENETILLRLITIAYEVIGAPFVNGSSHLMVTKSLV